MGAVTGRDIAAMLHKEKEKREYSFLNSVFNLHSVSLTAPAMDE